MNLSTSIDFPQLKAVIQQCNLNEKLELLKILEQEALRLPIEYRARLAEKLLSSLDDLSEPEIEKS